MSDLPQYSYNDADLESAPLVPADRKGQSGWSDSAVQATSNLNSSGPSGSGQPRHNVLYVFEPVYPVPGKREQVVGLLGRSKDECTAIAQRAFPTLLAYPDERIIFEVCSLPAYDLGAQVNGTARATGPAPVPGQLPTSYPPGSQGWSRIMDDAWDQFAVCPPGRLRVRVEESTSDIKLRNRRDLRNIMLAVVLPVLTVFVVGGVMVLASALVDGDD